jgi:uncharacterized protein involved in outer membrane biogenesis
MPRKVLLGLLLAFVVASAGVFVWARAVFTQENVRAALEGQLSEALGQPVTVGSIGVAIYPRVTVNLGEVAIGAPPRITAERLSIGTNLGALLWRRIEHADLRLTGARVELPLPKFAVPAGGTDQDAAAAGVPVELVSIDEIVLSDVQVVAGGRILRGDLELVPHGKGASIRKATLRAEEASLDIAGEVTDFAGPSGELTVSGGQLNLDELLVFASEFAGAALVGAPSERAQAPGPPMNLSITLSTERARMGALVLDGLSGRARISREAMTLEPMRFGLFGGKYEGTAVFSLGQATGFRVNAALSGLDVAAMMAFAGSPGTMTGRLSGTIDLAGAGTDAASAMQSARGTSRVDIANGTVRNLGLVRTIIVATSGRADAVSQGSDVSRDERFSRLRATLAIAGGGASTRDLIFESDDLLLSASGSVRLDASAIDLSGQVQLSDALAKRAGRDLVRYTQEQGRPTLPVRITGAAASPQVSVDVAGVLQRAITNRATEEVQKAMKKGLGGLFRR